MATGFKLHDPIVITFDKSEYEVGDNIEMNVKYSIDAKELLYGSMMKAHAEVWSGGNKISEGNDLLYYLGYGGIKELDVAHNFEFSTDSSGAFSGDVRVSIEPAIG